MNTIIFVLVTLSFITVVYGNLYSVLGVSKSATQQEIKLAYKKLAKKWHPDRNKNPGANNHFMKINEAYETLSNPRKRHEYDTLGTTSAHAGPQQYQQRYNSFHEFFGDNGGFNFGGGRRGSFDSGPGFEGIDYRSYKLDILPLSQSKPTLIFIYSDFCLLCIHARSVWHKSASDMMPLGLQFRAFHADMALQLRDELRITEVPAVVAVIGGHVSYHSGDISVVGIRNFVLNMFPVGLITHISDRSYKAFLAGWTDNRSRAILAKPLSRPPLRFLLSAFKHRHSVTAGYLDIADSAHSADFMLRYGVRQARETLLVFAEDAEQPAASVAAGTLKRETIDEVLDAHMELTLPRVSSSEHLERYCPPEMHSQRMTLCVLLLSTPGEENGPEMRLLRDVAQRHKARQDADDWSRRLRLLYVYASIQSEFIRALGKSLDEDVRKLTGRLVLLWRRDSQSAAYQWLEPDFWNVTEPERSRTRLFESARFAFHNAGRGDFLQPTLLPKLTNEHADPLLVRIWGRLRNLLDRTLLWMYYNLELNGLIMLLLTFGLAAGTAAMMSYLLREEEAKIRKRGTGASVKRPPPRPEETAGRRPDNSLYLRELKIENFRELVRASPQGHITLVLLVTESTKSKLLAQYASCLMSFLRLDKVHFTFLRVERHFQWYMLLLEQASGGRIGLQRSGGFAFDRSRVQARNCAGTVLALNGFRRYMCMYHPKIRNSLLHQRPPSQDSAAEFLGFGTSESETCSSADEKDAMEPLANPQIKLFERDLLSGLPNWLERLFDGQVTRFWLDEWPSFLPAAAGHADSDIDSANG